MQRLMATLKAKDVRLYCRIQEQNLKPEFYAFRWLTLLLSQEFPLPGKKNITEYCLIQLLRMVF
jgi:hypothetical protein